MIKRMSPNQIEAGKTYRLMGRYTPGFTAFRKVEEVRGDKVTVIVNGELKEFNIKLFADLAIGEVAADETKNYS